MGNFASTMGADGGAAGHGPRGDGGIPLLGNGTGGASAFGAGNVGNIPAVASSPNGDDSDAEVGAGGGADVEEAMQLLSWVVLELRGHAGAISGLRADSQDLEGRLAAVDQAGTELIVLVAAVQANVNAISGQIGDHNGLIGDINGLIGDINGLIGDHNGRIGDINGQIGDINGLIGDHNGLIVDLSGRIGDHNGLIGDINGQIGDLIRFMTLIKNFQFILFLLMATSIFYFANANELEHFGHLSMLWAGLATAFTTLKDAARDVEIAALRKEMAMIARLAERDDEEDDEEEEADDEEEEVEEEDFEAEVDDEGEVVEEEVVEEVEE